MCVRSPELNAGNTFLLKFGSAEMPDPVTNFVLYTAWPFFYAHPVVGVVTAGMFAVGAATSGRQVADTVSAYQPEFQQAWDTTRDLGSQGVEITSSAFQSAFTGVFNASYSGLSMASTWVPSFGSFGGASESGHEHDE